MEHFRSCLRSYSGHASIFPSKADRIMSRYRPIAPKPTFPSLSEADKSSSSAITFDNLCIRQVPDAPSSIAPLPSKQKSKRVRKRPSKDLDTQVPSKRLATGSLEKGLGHGLAADVAQLNIPEDVGFMERAAASAPSSVFPLEKARKTATNNSCGYGGCFTEMIRGIAGLPSAAHVHNLLQQQQQLQQQQEAPNFFNVLMKEPAKQLVDETFLQRNAREERDYSKEELSSDAFWSSFSGESMREFAERGVSEEQQQSGLDEEKSDGEDDGRRRVITLNLLPEAPSRGDSPTNSTCSSPPPQAVLKSSNNSLLYVEHVYGKSSEPVVLVDDLSRTVLWVNQGYVKACKDNSNTPATFIDPLGIPTQLGQFQVQVDGRSECIPATLWGFLKKLVVDLGDGDVPRGMPGNTSVPFESTKEAAQLPSVRPKGCVSQQKYCEGMLNNRQPMASMALDCLVASRVITPQPIRLVGSIVSLESITEVQTRDSMLGTWELAKKQLEDDSLPGFITDEAKVVRWVNTAYKVMVGQPECPWLVSTMKTGGESPTITGEVLLSCNVEVPHLATSFSGRANVQWTRNTGERSCMTIPCDVMSFVDSNARRILVWRFDIQASLSLTCGVER